MFQLQKFDGLRGRMFSQSLESLPSNLDRKLQQKHLVRPLVFATQLHEELKIIQDIIYSTMLGLLTWNTDDHLPAFEREYLPFQPVQNFKPIDVQLKLCADSQTSHLSFLHS